MDWKLHQANWPHSESSRFININGTIWHIQQKGSGPLLLLLHGSGASTHSFEGLIDSLLNTFSVVAIDLPGHGFSSDIKGRSPTIKHVCEAISQLLKAENLSPYGIIGHSAGAAIAVHLEHEGYVDPEFLVSINGAFFPFPGFAGQIFPAAAKFLFLNPFVPKLFAFSASDEKRVERLMVSTGSQLSSHQLGFYKSLFKSSEHVKGTLAMMANWSLDAMAEELKKLEKPLLQIIGSQDKTIDPDSSFAVERFVQNNKRVVLDGFGHLVHEEEPDMVSSTILEFLKNDYRSDNDVTCAN